MGTRQVIVLGGGIVGMSTALHLQRRGIACTVVDRGDPRLAASYGNGGLIQREAVFPYRFPRDPAQLLRMAGNRSVDVSYQLAALVRMAPRLLRYWAASADAPYARSVRAEAALIATCIDAHLDLAHEAGAQALLRPIGWMRAYEHAAGLDAAIAVAEAARSEFGVNFAALDGQDFARAEPAFRPQRAGAIHWTESLSLSEPGDLVQAYMDLFRRRGGQILTGDATAVERHGSGWRLRTEGGLAEGSDLVVALGAASARVTRRLGLNLPLFGKRGYHMHYRMEPGQQLNRPLLDDASGFLLAPMARGVRLTTGVEFALDGRKPTPVQLGRAEPIARRLLPLAGRAEDQPWLGTRPCMPDMLPVIGASQRVPGLWLGFGHGHQGMTLGPTTGRMLAEMINGEAPFVAAEPYSPGRFAA